MRRPRPLWLDCDPGHDDALAIVLAAHSPALCTLLGVSTVASNHTLEAVTANAAAVLAAINATTTRARTTTTSNSSSNSRSDDNDESDNNDKVVPLHAGAASPLLLPPKTCPEIHGSSGLCVSGGAFADVVARRLRERGPGHLLSARLDRWRSAKGAVEAMADAIERAAAELEKEEREEEEKEKEGEGEEEPRRRRRRKVALVATGALTNVALLLWTRPDLAAKFELYLMGGAMGQGNTGVVAEFNFEVDPHAAAAVFGFGGGGDDGDDDGDEEGGQRDLNGSRLRRRRPPLSITMVPLEVTHTALVTPAVLEKLRLGRQGGGDGNDDGNANDNAAADDNGDGNKRPPPPRKLSPLREALRSVLLYFAETYSSHFGFDVGPPLHDPLAVLAAISSPSFYPSSSSSSHSHSHSSSRPCFSLTHARVDIETSSPLSLGQSIVDLRPELGRSASRGKPNGERSFLFSLSFIFPSLYACLLF